MQKVIITNLANLSRTLYAGTYYSVNLQNPKMTDFNIINNSFNDIDPLQSKSNKIFKTNET